MKEIARYISQGSAVIDVISFPPPTLDPWFALFPWKSVESPTADNDNEMVGSIRCRPSYQDNRQSHQLKRGIGVHRIVIVIYSCDTWATARSTTIRSCLTSSPASSHTQHDLFPTLLALFTSGTVRHASAILTAACFATCLSLDRLDRTGRRGALLELSPRSSHLVVQLGIASTGRPRSSRGMQGRGERHVGVVRR